MTAVAYADDDVVLHHASYSEVLPSIEGADLAIVDPPYGDTSLEWDRSTVAWLPAVGNALAPHGTIWLWGSLRYLARAIPAAEAEGWTLAQDIVWEKHNGSSSAADRFRRVHEHVVHLYRGAWADTHHEPQFSLDATKRAVRRKQRPAHWGDIGEAAYRSEDGGPRHMRSVMYERSAHGIADHPTQKPEGLTRTLIQYACPPGGLVVSPFAGSATDLVAARACGRRAVGTEVNSDYVAAAAARLAHAPLQLDVGAST